MNILKKTVENVSNKTKDKLPFAVFICPEAGNGELQDYRQVFTNIISNRIEERFDNSAFSMINKN